MYIKSRNYAHTYQFLVKLFSTLFLFPSSMRLILVFFCTLTYNQTISQVPYGKIWAVAVGIGDYSDNDSFEELAGPANQAHEFKGFVERNRFTDNDNVPILTDESATKLAILRTLKRTFLDPTKVKSTDLVIFYYTGHGATVGDQIGICPYDYFDMEHLISEEEIISIMRDSPAKHKVCIIESCKSKMEIEKERKKTMGFTPLDPIDKYYFNQKRNQIKDGIVYITSTEPDSNSFELPELNNRGVFSHYFLLGIKGAADRNQDQDITSKELFDYLQETVSRHTDSCQIPQINKEGYDLDVPIFTISAQPELAYDGRVETYKRADIPPLFTFIEGGEFVMGDVFEEGKSDEIPIHDVNLAHFFMANHELSFDEYDLFCEDTGRRKPRDNGWGRGNQPVINVSWYDAIEYCNWRSQVEGFEVVYLIDKRTADPVNINPDIYDPKWTVRPNWNANGYRLPTEEEWEYAARQGGQKVRFGHGYDSAYFSEINYRTSTRQRDESYHRPSSVDSYTPNALNLYHMSGNVWEWCWDWSTWYPKSDSIQKEGRDESNSPQRGRERIIRGGSWNSPLYDCRTTHRNRREPTFRSKKIGFRLARSF